MQLWMAVTASNPVMVFQYPRSDRRRCNRRIRTPCGSALGTFSILGRIGGDATDGLAHPDAGGGIFQYPRSDRRRCNSHLGLPWRHGSPPFSILGRIGGDATTTRNSPPGSLAPFSILGRIGGDATAGGRRGRRRGAGTFSILGRIGGDATRGGQGEPCPDFRLSVSSVGSEAMQRCHADSPTTASTTFSILGRIGGDATPRPPSGSGGSSSFQYPRSDRRRCNAVDRARQANPSGPFSILGRIGGDATHRPAPPAGAGRPTFSILGRIGGDATGVFLCQALFVVPFQYPRSDRRRCNEQQQRQDDDELHVFQYPRSDRRRCN